MRKKLEQAVAILAKQRFYNDDEDKRAAAELVALLARHDDGTADLPRKTVRDLLTIATELIERSSTRS